MSKKLPKLIVGPSEIEGDGVHTMEFIAKGRLIRYYTGEIITQDEKKRREVENKSQGIEKTYFFGLSDGTIVDATKRGNEARFINHCCEVRF